jgi:NAD:arginine ADP-ribosyltransferase/Hemolysin coregulated protein Hcp (TssD)
MQNASLEAFLSLEGVATKIPLDSSYSEWRQAIDHRGRPRGKVRYGRWHFATSTLNSAQYEQLLTLMLSSTARVDAHATYARADGQGQFVTVWGTGCYLVHLHSHFDARGTHGQEPGWTIYFTLAAEEMGREAGAAGAFVPPVARSYAYSGPAEVAATSSTEDITEILFKDNTLIEIRKQIASGILPRKHAEHISIEEQAVIAYYTTGEGYRNFNLALRGQLPTNKFFVAQEKILNQALSKLPKHTGSVVRGTGSTEIPIFDKISVGEVVEYKNFVSTSLDEAIADDFMYRKQGEYVLRVNSKKGVCITEMSLAPAEDEILFSSKSRFKVIGKSYRPRFTEDDPLVKEIYLEEI